MLEPSDPEGVTLCGNPSRSHGLSEDPSPTQPNLCYFFHCQRTQAANKFNVRAVTFGSLVELANIVACESSLCCGSLSVPCESIPRI